MIPHLTSSPSLLISFLFYLLLCRDLIQQAAEALQHCREASPSTTPKNSCLILLPCPSLLPPHYTESYHDLHAQELGEVREWNQRLHSLNASGTAVKPTPPTHPHQPLHGAPQTAMADRADRAVGHTARGVLYTFWKLGENVRNVVDTILSPLQRISNCWSEGPTSAERRGFWRCLLSPSLLSEAVTQTDALHKTTTAMLEVQRTISSLFLIHNLI